MSPLEMSQSIFNHIKTLKVDNEEYRLEFYRLALTSSLAGFLESAIACAENRKNKLQAVKASRDSLNRITHALNLVIEEEGLPHSKFKVIGGTLPKKHDDRQLEMDV